MPPISIKEWSDNTITTSSISSDTIKIADTIFEDKIKDDELQRMVAELQEIVDELQDQVLFLTHKLNKETNEQ